MTSFVVEPSQRPLLGHVVVPGDKSVGHRALLFSLLSETPVRVRGLGDGADNGRSARAITALGARIESAGGELVITGTGLRGMRAPASPVALSRVCVTTAASFANPSMCSASRARKDCGMKSGK